jgi:transposase-like protein
MLDAREKYWIAYYDSYKNGYNSTLGGRLIQLYNWDMEEIIQLYHKTKSARQVAKIIGCDHSTIDNLLNAN